VKGIRLKHQLFVTRSQSPPRRIPGSLTVPPVATALGVSPHWLYDRIKKGAIKANRDADTGLYLCPDTSETLEQFNQFKIGTLKQLCFDAMREGQSPASPVKARADLV
jgi:hypothetical protein